MGDKTGFVTNYPATRSIGKKKKIVQEIQLDFVVQLAQQLIEKLSMIYARE